MAEKGEIREWQQLKSLYRGLILGNSELSLYEVWYRPKTATPSLFARVLGLKSLLFSFSQPWEIWVCVSPSGRKTRIIHGYLLAHPSFPWNLLNTSRVYAGLCKCCWSQKAWTLELDKVGFKSWHFLLWTFLSLSYSAPPSSFPSKPSFDLAFSSNCIISCFSFSNFTMLQVFNLPSYQKDFLCWSWPPRVLLECFCSSGSSLTSGDLFL